MEDTIGLLPLSREFFRKFLYDHKHEIFEEMREYRVGPGTGYSCSDSGGGVRYSIGRNYQAAA